MVGIKVYAFHVFYTNRIREAFFIHDNGCKAFEQEVGRWSTGLDG